MIVPCIFVEFMDRFYTVFMQNGHGIGAWREVIAEKTHPNIAR